MTPGNDDEAHVRGSEGIRLGLQLHVGYARAHIDHWPRCRAAGNETRAHGDWWALRYFARKAEPVIAEVAQGFGFVAAIGTMFPTAYHTDGHRRGLTGEFLDLCRTTPDQITATHEGSFLTIVVDDRERRVSVYGDHLMSRPVFVTEGPLGVAVASRGWDALALVGRRARLSPEGALGFLCLGYPVADNTLLEGVSRVGVGSSVRLGLRGEHASASLRRVWRLSFAVPTRPRLPEAVDQLHSVLRQSHHEATSDAHGDHLVALTGGYDSRLMLALLREAGAPPSATFTWSVDARARDSDGAIAREIAGAFGIKHLMLEYSTHAFTDNVAESLENMESLSDNLGLFAAGRALLTNEQLAPGPVFLGDHLIGLGPSYHSASEGIAHALGIPWPTLPRAVRAVFADADAGSVGERFRAQVSPFAVAGDALSGTPKNANLNVSLHVAVQGWLLAPGFFKEPAFQALRPMLSRGVLELVASWPDHLRTDKRVLVSLLQREFPDLVRIPVAAAATGVTDWTVALQRDRRLHEFFLAIDRKRLAEVFGVCVRYDADAIFADAARTTPRPAWKARAARAFVAARRGLSVVPGGDLLFRSIRGPMASARGPSNVRVGFRLALLSRFAKAADAMDRADGCLS